MDARLLVAAVASCAACAGHARSPTPAPTPERAALTGDILELHRDVAIVEQRVVIHAAAAGVATFTVTLPPNVAAAAIVPVDYGAIEVVEIHAANDHAGDGGSDGSSDGWREAQQQLDDSDNDSGSAQLVAAPGVPAPPTVIALDLRVPRAGELALGLVYAVDDLHWDASYELTTTASRRSATARGAIAIRNATGVAFHAQRVAVIDDEVGTDREGAVQRMSCRRGAPTACADRPDVAAAESHPATPRELGALAIGDGELRLELYRPGATRALRPLLVFDPFDPKLDLAAQAPERGLAYDDPTSTEVTDRIEIARADEDRGMPGGAATLLERAPDGSLAAIARGEMFGASARVATFDTLALGVAADVTAKRVRRDYALDLDRNRLTEEFAIEIDNQRGRPIEIAALEHLFRGATWAVGYASTSIAQVGPQQIALRSEVPAHGKQSMMYVVVYWWLAQS